MEIHGIFQFWEMISGPVLVAPPESSISVRAGTGVAFARHSPRVFAVPWSPPFTSPCSNLELWQISLPLIDVLLNCVCAAASAIYWNINHIVFIFHFYLIFLDVSSPFPIFLFDYEVSLKNFISSIFFDNLFHIFLILLILKYELLLVMVCSHVWCGARCVSPSGWSCEVPCVWAVQEFLWNTF